MEKWAWGILNHVKMNGIKIEKVKEPGSFTFSHTTIFGVTMLWHTAKIYIPDQR